MKSLSRAPVWLWPNLLSLDAPLVAVVWQDFLARCYPSMLRPAGRWTLGLTVWAIYLADRIIDVRGPEPLDESARHRFYRHHRIFTSLLLAAAVLAGLLIAVLWLRPAVFSEGLWVLGASACYLGLFALLRLRLGRSKQFFAAILFTAGVFLVAWTSMGIAPRILVGPAVMFCLLCLENLSLIGSWEEDRPGSRGWLWLIPVAAVAAVWGDSRWYTAIALSPPA